MSNTATAADVRAETTQAARIEDLEEADTGFQDVVNAGDLGTVVAAYGEGAVFLVEPGQRARGRDEIRQAWTPGRSFGAKGLWVTLDEHWGERLGAQRNGRMYRLPRREFVRKMSELRGSGMAGQPHVLSISKASGLRFESETTRAGTQPAA